MIPIPVYDLYIILSTAYAKLHHMPDNSIVIVNPNSKGGQTGKNWDSIEQIMRKYFGNNLKFVFTEKTGGGTLLTRKYLEQGSTHMIPIGGDWIINEVTIGFFKKNINSRRDSVDFKNIKYDDLLAITDVEPINQDAVLVILPGGTRNVLVRSLGLPADLRNVVRSYQHQIILKRLMLLLH